MQKHLAPEWHADGGGDSLKRHPAWTDRIMYTTYTDTPDTPTKSTITNALYTSIPSYTTSDHVSPPSSPSPYIPNQPKTPPETRRIRPPPPTLSPFLQLDTHAHIQQGSPDFPLLAFSEKNTNTYVCTFFSGVRPPAGSVRGFSVPWRKRKRKTGKEVEGRLDEPSP